MADVPGGMAIQGGCLHPPNGAILHRYRATGDEQISAVNVNPLPGDGHRVNRQTLASPLLSGREVRVARRDGLGRSTMDTAGGEDNSGVTLNTPLCTASGPIATPRLPPSPCTPLPCCCSPPRQ